MRNILDKISNIITGTEDEIKEYFGTITLIIIRALLVGFCLYPMLDYLPLPQKLILIMFYLAFILLDTIRYLAEDQADINMEYIDSLETIAGAYSSIANSLLNVIEKNDIELEGYGDNLIKEIRRVSKDTSEIIKGE